MLRIPGMVLAAGLIAVGAAVAVGPGSHVKASSLKQTICFPDPDTGGQDCFTFKGAVTSTVTPSGNTSSVTEGPVTLAVTDNTGAVVFTTVNVVHFHALMTQDGTVLQESGEHVRYSDSNGCIATYAIHMTNDGQIQYSNVTFSPECG